MERDLRRAPFKRITSPGTTDAGRLFVMIDWDGHRLSITGVEGPRSNGNAQGSCGQTGIPAGLKLDTGWDTDASIDVDRLRRAWDRWHLNDMRAGCEHQRNDPAHDISKPLALQVLGWGPCYYPAKKIAESGEMEWADYEKWRATYISVQRLTRHDGPKHPDLWGGDGAQLLESGYLKIDKTETKTAGWVDYREHPDGLLSKPCTVCGYCYGSAWLYEEVPTDVLEFLRALPDDTNDMPQRWRD